MFHAHHYWKEQNLLPELGTEKWSPIFREHIFQNLVQYRKKPPQILKAIKENLSGAGSTAAHPPAWGRICILSPRIPMTWPGMEGQHLNSASDRSKWDLLHGLSSFLHLITFPLVFAAFLWTSLSQSFKLNVWLNQSTTIVYSIFDLSGWLSLSLTASAAQMFVQVSLSQNCQNKGCVHPFVWAF